MTPSRYCLGVPDPAGGAASGLEALTAEVIACRACPRLVAWREEVAVTRRAAYRDQQYWGRPVPGFGDPAARLVVVGLAPAAHGGNRTGRVFTGDRSGDWLFASLHRLGFANQAASVAADDGLQLRDAYVLAAVRCAPPANRPSVSERERCLPFAVRELALLEHARVLLALGGFAYQVSCRLAGAVAPPRFAHGVTATGGRYAVVGSYHPSQQNTFTGRLTEAMLDGVLRRAAALAGIDAEI